MLLLVALGVSATVPDTVTADTEKLDASDMDKTEVPDKDEENIMLVPEGNPKLLADNVPEIGIALTPVDVPAVLLIVVETPRLDDADFDDPWGPVVEPACKETEVVPEIKDAKGVFDVAGTDPLEDAVICVVSLVCMGVAMDLEVETEVEVRGNVEKAKELLVVVAGLVVELADGMADVDAVDAAVDRTVAEVVVKLARRLDAEAEDELGADVDTPTLSALIISAAFSATA